MRKLCRVVFSRYAISLIMILLSLALLSYIILFASAYSVYAFVIMSVIDVLVVVSIINKDTNPEYKIPWLVIAIIVPFFGATLYLIFSSRKLSRKEARFLKRISEAADIAADNERIFSLSFLSGEEPGEHAEALGKIKSILKNDYGSRAFVSSGSEYYPSGEEMFSHMLEDIAAAEKYIFLEYFILEEGKMWDAIFALLKQKAASGVDVRVIYDDVGSMKTLPASFLSSLNKCGIRCVRFGKVTPRVSVIHNNRDHRKICCIDGAVAYTGGINIADEYINEKERFGHWKDGGVCVSGYAAIGFVRLFLSMWDFTVGAVSNYSEYFESVKESRVDDGGIYVPFGSGPAPHYTHSSGKTVLLNIINQAKKYVYVTTPYLIVDYALTEALVGAAERGVEIIIITPGKADKKLVKIMTKSSYPTLISAGVKIYEYTPGFIHEKLMVSDDEYAVVGTINLDYRSLVHHYEDALWMYRTPTVKKIADEFKKTLEVSEEMDAATARLTLFERAVRSLTRLFAPLL